MLGHHLLVVSIVVSVLQEDEVVLGHHLLVVSIVVSVLEEDQVVLGHHLLVVSIVVSVLEEDQVMLGHHLPAQHHRQELVVADVLVHRRPDVPRLLQMPRGESKLKWRIFFKLTEGGVYYVGLSAQTGTRGAGMTNG